VEIAVGNDGSSGAQSGMVAPHAAVLLHMLLLLFCGDKLDVAPWQRLFQRLTHQWL
jgi:hypothetical protein